MKKVCIALSLIISSVLFFSCEEFLPFYKEKITKYENTITTLQTENENLKKEIEAYKLTDQYFYQAGADEFLKGNFTKAIDYMNSLKVKFPTSSLIGYADKIIKDSEEKNKKKNRVVIWDETGKVIPAEEAVGSEEAVRKYDIR